MAKEDFSFSAFAELDFYYDVNASLLDLTNLNRYERIVDLGCGTGGVTHQILDRVISAKDHVVYAVDHSRGALKLAMSYLGKRKENSVRFVHSEAQNFNIAIAEEIDAVVYCNSIHYLADKFAALRNICEKLRPGGLLAMNTSFFTTDVTPEATEFYKRWMLRSRRTLKTDYGLSTQKEKVQSRMHLSREEYEEVIRSAGFKIEVTKVVRHYLSERAWHQISSFRDWIEGSMPGVPLDEGRVVLQKALHTVFSEMGIDSVPRNWLSITAVKA